MPALVPLVLSDPRRVGLLAAEIVANRLGARPGARLLLPTGRTPGELYAALRAHAARGTLATVLQLDEYLGLTPAEARSMASQLRRSLLGSLVTIDGTAPDAATRHEAALEAPVSPDCPASLLRDHPRLAVVCDRAAAGALEPRAEWSSDRVLVVLGHRDPGISPEHRVSRESRARLRRALALARARPVRAVVLTGYTSAGGLSEAEQMKTAWDEAEAPALLEVRGRNTAENASCSLPLILALGEARRVTVVSSAWHLRVPWFFAPDRRFGLDVDYRASFAHGAWPRMLAREIREARRAPAERRAALGALRLPPFEAAA